MRTHLISWLFSSRCRDVSISASIEYLTSSISSSVFKIHVGYSSRGPELPIRGVLFIIFGRYVPLAFPNLYPVLGLDTNFRIFLRYLDVFEKFRKKNVDFWSICHKNVADKGRITIFYNLLLGCLHNLQFFGNFRSPCSVYEPAILHIEQI